MSEDVKVKDDKIYETFSITMELERPLLVYEEEDNSSKVPKKKTIYRNILVGAIGLLIIGVIVFLIWASNSYKPQEIAKQALVSDNTVDVNVSDYISFTPKNVDATKGFIFYPGAKVEPEAYAPIARKVAEQGYEVIIAKMPFNLAIFSPSEAEKIVDDYKNIESWTIGGHSLGGVMASKFASDNKYIDGVVLLASYPMGNELKNLGKEVVSIWGSSDGVLNFESLYSSKANLPQDTTYVEIEGGNHAQFGDYGKQSGDSDALISQDEQMKIATKSIIDFMNKLK